VRGGGYVRVLTNGAAAGTFDRKQPSRAIVATAAQHHANDLGAMGTRSAAKKNIDSGTMSVFPRATGENGHPVLDRQVVLGRRTINAATFVAFLMSGSHSGKIAAATQNLWQHRFGTDVHHNNDR